MLSLYLPTVPSFFGTHSSFRQCFSFELSEPTAQSQSTNNGFFNKLNSTVQKAVNGAQQVVGDLSGSQSANSASNNTSHTMYEVFAPKFGIGRKFIFTDIGF